MRFIDGERPVSAHRSAEMPKLGARLLATGAPEPEVYTVTDYIASIQK